MVPRYLPNSWTTRASPATTGVRPRVPTWLAMMSKTATTIMTTGPGPWARTIPAISNPTPASRAAMLSTRIRTPDTDQASRSVTGGAGSSRPGAADICVFIVPPVFAGLMFSFPPEDAPRDEGKDQCVPGQHQQRGGRELALHRVLERFRRRPERGVIADALKHARHVLTRQPHASEEQERVKHAGSDGAGGGPAPGGCRDRQPDGEQRGGGEHDGQHQCAGVFRGVQPEGRDAHDHDDEQRGHGDAELDDELGGQQPGRGHRRGRKPAQDPLVTVRDKRGRQAYEPENRDHEGNDDRDVHGEQAETSEAGLGLVEAGQLAEDDQQHLRNRDTEAKAGRRPQGEPGLVADYRAERGPRCRFRQQRLGVERLGVQRPRVRSLRPWHCVRVHARIPSSCRCRPVSLTKASSRVEESSSTSWAVTPAAARVRITTLTSSPVPLTMTREPLRLTVRTSGRSVRRWSAKGAEGTNRTVFPPRTRAASPAGLSSVARCPASMRATRSHSRSASSMKCVTRRIVTPRSRTPSMRFQVSRRACGSSPDVISSSTATFGRPMRASAMDSRCRWPPDRDR